MQCKRATLLGCWHVPESYVLTVRKRSISDPAHTSGCLCSPRATHVGRQQRRRRTGTCSGTRRTVEPPDQKKKTDLRKNSRESRTKSTTRATISKKNVHQPDQKKTRNRVPPGVDTQPRGTCQQHANLSDPAHTSGSWSPCAGPRQQGRSPLHRTGTCSRTRRNRQLYPPTRKRRQAGNRTQGSGTAGVY